MALEYIHVFMAVKSLEFHELGVGDVSFKGDSRVGAAKIIHRNCGQHVCNWYR